MMLTEIDALYQKATTGPWKLRPLKHDDWGFVRSADDTLIANFATSAMYSGFRQYADLAGFGMGSEQWHDGPTEVQANAQLAIALVNAWPKLREEIQTLKAAAMHAEIQTTNFQAIAKLATQCAESAESRLAALRTAASELIAWLERNRTHQEGKLADGSLGIQNEAHHRGAYLALDLALNSAAKLRALLDPSRSPASPDPPDRSR